MLYRIVWQVFADNRPSKIARQSTVCIWFGQQNSVSTLRTDCGSSYGSAHALSVRRCFYFLLLDYHRLEIHTSNEKHWLFSPSVAEGRGGKSEQILAPSVEVWCSQGRAWQSECFADTIVFSLWIQGLAGRRGNFSAGLVCHSVGFLGLLISLGADWVKTDIWS